MVVTSISRIGMRSLNEDSLVVDEERKLFAVFDGASSLDGYVNEQGKTGGFIASHTASETFISSPNTDLRTLFQEANASIEQKHVDARIDTSEPLHRFGTAVAAARITGDAVEFLQCNDSIVLTISHKGVVSSPLGYYDQDVPALLQWRELARQGKKGRNEIRPLIDSIVNTTRNQANRQFGQLNGDPSALNFARFTHQPLQDLAAILLLTDGMYLPKEDPEQPENWSPYFDLVYDGGLEKLLSTVRSLEEADEDIVKYPRFKVHDDATGIFIDLR